MNFVKFIRSSRIALLCLMFLFIAVAVAILNYVQKKVDSYQQIERFTNELRLLCQDGDEDACKKLANGI